MGEATVTLHAAVWDGSNVWVSMDIESPRIPEKVQRYTPLYMADCRLLRDDQWEEYTRNRVEESGTAAGESPEEIEADIQEELAKGQQGIGGFLSPEEREGNTLKFQENVFLEARWFTETKRPELTLHLENIATYADGKGEAIIDENGYAQDPGPGEIVIPGPFDLTFTLNEPILPIHYSGADVEAAIGVVPMHFTEFEFSVTGLTARGEVLAPVSMFQPNPEGGRIPDTDPDNLNTQDIVMAELESTWGIWTDDGKYVDLTNMGGPGGGCLKKTYT